MDHLKTRIPRKFKKGDKVKYIGKDEYDIADFKNFGGGEGTIAYYSKIRKNYSVKFTKCKWGFHFMEKDLQLLECMRSKWL